MQAGHLRHRIEIQAVTRSRDAIGGYAESWATAATRWASIEPQKQDEKDSGEQTTAWQTVKIRMRYYDGLTPKHRIVWDGNVYEIQGVTSWRERDIMTDVVAIQRDGDTSSGSGS